MNIKSEEAKVIIFSGKARSGKDTSAGYVKEILESKGLKVINTSYASYIKEYAKKISSWDGSDETKPRELLQILGTEIIRKNLGYDFFIKRIIDDIKVYGYFFDVVTISDARFPEEITMIRDNFKNVVSINLERNVENDLTSSEKLHATEVSLDNFNDYDYVIDNNGSLEELYNKVKETLK